ncbi:NADPH-dependent FMN reductase [Lewinella sp. IMCC34183]|uniref:NADPH-dependent FMN reductase n=1 Tax=Lewinella sp. IMCC34183 TaxID=2248762 RepID=UPI000E265D2D|nr:NAD(P)H-dependent oxidoreductase [Lewinella sp. IMCC34183]
MSHYLTVAGSTRPDSANARLLASLSYLTTTRLEPAHTLRRLPLFAPDLDVHPAPAVVAEWRQQWRDATAVILSTPAYLDNLPGTLKNGFDWLSSTGEARDKPVLACTFCPHAPRGEHAMLSLLWTLKALDARVVAQLPLFQRDISFLENGDIEDGDDRALLVEALHLLP